MPLLSDAGRCSHATRVVARALAPCHKPGIVSWGLSLGQEQDDVASSVAIAPDGYAYIVGTLGGRAMHEGSSAFLAKIDAHVGSVVSQFELAAGTELSMRAVAVSADGKVAVAGAYDGSLRIGAPHTREFGDPTAFVMVFDSSGKVLWTWAGDRDGFARPVAVAFDDCGGVLLAGTFMRRLIPDRVESPAADGRDGFVLRFDSAGELVWTRRLGGAGNQTIVSAEFKHDGSIALLGSSDSGELLVGASRYQFDGGSVAFIAELTDAGEGRWVKQIASQQSQRSIAAVVRADGETLVVGGVDSANGATDLVLRQLDARAEPGWQKVYGHRDWGSRMPADLAVSQGGTWALVATLSGSIRLGTRVLRSHGWAIPRASRQIPPTDVLVGTFDRNGKPVRAWLLGDDSWQEARGIQWVEPNWGIVVGTFEDAIPLGEGRVLQSAGGRDAFAIALCLE